MQGKQVHGHIPVVHVGTGKATAPYVLQLRGCPHWGQEGSFVQHDFDLKYSLSLIGGGLCLRVDARDVDVWTAGRECV